MIYVVAKIELNSGAAPAYLAVFAEIAPLVRAKAGCLEYVATVDTPTGLPWQQSIGLDHVTIIEKWESVQALQAHNESSQMQTARLRLRDLVRGRVINILAPA